MKLKMNQLWIDAKNLWEEKNQEKGFYHNLAQDSVLQQVKADLFKKACETIENERQEAGLQRWLVQPFKLKGFNLDLDE